MTKMQRDLLEKFGSWNEDWTALVLSYTSFWSVMAQRDVYTTVG